LEVVASDADLHDAEQRHYAAAPADLRYNIAGVNTASPVRSLSADASMEFFAILADIVSGRWQWERENGPAMLHTLRSLDGRLCAAEMRVFGDASPTIGSVHPLAIQVMREIGIGISAAAGHSAKSLDELAGQPPMDLVVTVCDDAAEECPYFPGARRQEHWGFPDPSAATGSEEERLAAFRSVRDAIACHIETFLQMAVP
jgi:arsenate reductase